jgi:mono/diheme cytochrome c family protein
MKRGLAIGGFAVLVLGTAGFLVLRQILDYGFSVHDEPTRVEALTARKVRHWAVPADLRQAGNPVALTPEVLVEARAHFADHCATCHGVDGKGRTQIGERLYPRAPDMTLDSTQSLSDGELFSIIENGIRLTGMPGWGEGTAESGYGSWTLVHLIRRLPQLTREEIEEMKRLGPQSSPQSSPQRSPGGDEPALHQH